MTDDRKAMVFNLATKFVCISQNPKLNQLSVVRVEKHNPNDEQRYIIVQNNPTGFEQSPSLSSEDVMKVLVALLDEEEFKIKNLDTDLSFTMRKH